MWNCQSGFKNENVKKDLKLEVKVINRKLEETNDRLDEAHVQINELEAKLDRKEEFNIQYSIVVQNLPAS